MPQPLYLRVADALRARIISGEYPPGAKLPSRAALAAEHDVAVSVANQAMQILIAEGHVEARAGSGSYVRRRPPMRRLTRSWYTDIRGTSPFRAEQEAQGRTGGWRNSSATGHAPADIAERLGIREGGPVMITRYVFLADDQPVMLSTSYEPLELTRGTDIVLPEQGPHAGLGVVERMARIGQRITSAVELVGARAASVDEAAELGIPAGAAVITIARTYHTDDRPVEHADIVIPADRYEVAYMLPVGTD